MPDAHLDLATGETPAVPPYRLDAAVVIKQQLLMWFGDEVLDPHPAPIAHGALLRCQVGVAGLDRRKDRVDLNELSAVAQRLSLRSSLYQ